MLDTNNSSDTHFVLATDLDGTFLGGDDAARNSLYTWIQDNRPQIGLIFVSGRDLPFIERLCTETDVPWPDYVIGDVGTTLAERHPKDDAWTYRPIDKLEEEIAGRWNDAGDTVRKALADAPGLRPQDTPFRYRMSYHYDPEAYDSNAEKLIEAMGYDVLISDNRFFDVLPRGVSKGPSLLRLIEFLGHDPSRVLVAGDTLNDLSMFETGVPGVAVGNSEPALIERIAGRPNIHFAEGHGAAGIREAIDAFNFDPAKGGTTHAV